jgi:hypothetical protein
MRRWLPSLGLAGLGLIGVLCVVSASLAALPPQWSPAIEVPGTAALNAGSYADVEAVSCATPGNCAAGGYYSNQWGGQEAFVVDETNGTWGTAMQVPGTTIPNGMHLADVSSIACPTAGNCVAGGSYFGSAGPTPFVVSEVDGTWGTAQDLPGMSSLNIGGDGAGVDSVSCASAGNCTAGGTYSESAGAEFQPFVVDETDGTWGTAIEVPGMSGLNIGHDGHLTAVSCRTAGNCAAVGFYQDASFRPQAFVVDERNGTWSTAVKVPGTTALETGGGAELDSVSCPADGNCVAGGSYGHYAESGDTGQPFLVAETNGTWGTATEVSGAEALNHGLARVESVSCGTVGNCAAGGFYTDGAGNTEVFVVDETSGSWDSAIQLPGTAGLNHGGLTDRLRTVSCGAAGACVAAGYYGTDDTSADGYHAFVASEANGIWSAAIEVPGTAALSPGGAARVDSVSCVSAHDCAAGGTYRDASGNFQAFLSTSAQVGATTLAPPDAGGVYGGTTNLTAILTSGGNGVAGAKVSFTLNGANVGSATTNVNGVATLQNVSLEGIAVGTYQSAVGASFDGDGDPTLASSGSSSLTVYPAGLVGATAVSVNTSGATIDSFDSSRGAYNAKTNHGSAALVMSNGTPGLAGVTVFGGATSTRGSVTVAATAHVTGNIKAGTTASIHGTVGGTVTANSPSTAFSRPKVAACSPFSPKRGMQGGTFTYSSRTGDLTLSKGTIKLAKGTYCFHSIALPPGTSLTVNDKVTLNLTGKITGGGHIVNSTDNPANLHIDSSYSGTGGLTFQGSSHGYMTILAPATSVTISGGSFFGTLFAGTVNLKGATAFHADTR